METFINFIRHIFSFVLTRPPFAGKKYWKCRSLPQTSGIMLSGM